MKKQILIFLFLFSFLNVYSKTYHFINKTKKTVKYMAYYKEEKNGYIKSTLNFAKPGIIITIEDPKKMLNFSRNPIKSNFFEIKFKIEKSGKWKTIYDLNKAACDRAQPDIIEIHEDGIIRYMKK